ncbi:MAG: hypothetical protein AB1847_00955 [bacterium]
MTAGVQIDQLIDFAKPAIALQGLVDTDGIAYTAAIYGNRAYVGGSTNISIVDISDPQNPGITGTFGPSDNIYSTHILDNNLVILHGEYTNVDIYSLADPDHPSLIGHTNSGYHFSSWMFLSGNSAFASTGGYQYNTDTLVINRQFGDFLSFDLSDISNPQFLDILLNTDGPDWGSAYNFGLGMAVNDQIALVPTTTVKGSDTQTGVGRILVVDISDPANLTIVKELQIPGTVHLWGVAIQGDLALVTGSSGGRRNPGIPDFAYIGNLTLSTVDISSPHDPVLIKNIVTQSKPSQWAHPVSAGNGYFTVSAGRIDDETVLILADAHDPQDLVVTTMSVPGLIWGTTVAGNTLYTTGDAGLGIYDLSGLVDTSVTTQVRIPKNSGISYVPDSFNIHPTQIISGSDFDILRWDDTLSSARSSDVYFWELMVTDLQPGETRQLTQDTVIDFTLSNGDSGQITLPPLVVAGGQILGLSPAARTSRPGERVTYTLIVDNPTDTAVTYDLSLQGLPGNWVDLPSSVTVPASGRIELALAIISKAFAPEGEYGFVINASAPTGARASVYGDLTLQGLPAIRYDSHGIVLGLDPDRAWAGQGTQAGFSVRLTNTGNVTESFALAGAFPAGFSYSFGQTTVEVPPGLDNYREVSLSLTPAADTGAGDYAFTVTASSIVQQQQVSDEASGIIAVLENGVNVTITPKSGLPPGIFQLDITNTGDVQDTFDLTLGGPAAPAASIGTQAVTLVPDQTAQATITLGQIDFAYQGTLNLTALASSRGNPLVQDSDTAAITIAPARGLAVNFDPNAIDLPAPGSTAFLLIIHNTGNTEEAYSAAITGAYGPVTASLTGLDSQPTQTIPVFRLPGLGTGALLLNADLTAAGEGRVTVTVRSGDASLEASATGVLRTSAQIPPPEQNRADISLGISDAPDPVITGQELIYFLQAKNNGPSFAEGVRLTVVLPPGAAFQSAVSTRGTCSELYGTVTCTIGGMDSGENVNVTIVAAAPQEAGTITATAQAVSYTADPVYTNNQVSETTLVEGQADLSIQTRINQNLSLQPDGQQSDGHKTGEQVVFTITVTNNGPCNASEIQVKDVLPSGLHYLHDNSGYDPATGIWNIGYLSAVPPDNKAILSLTARVAQAGEVIHIGSIIASDLPDPDHSNNSSAVYLNGGSQADLAIEKTVDQKTPSIGEVVTFTITMTNNGPDMATGIQVTDVLPEGLVYQSSQTSWGIYDPGTGLWLLENLPVGTKAVLYLQAKVQAKVNRQTDQTGLINTATISWCDQRDPDITNNTSSVMLDQDTQIYPSLVDMAVQKTVNQKTAMLGERVVFTIVARNNGPDQAHEVFIKDILPAGLDFSSSITSQGQYDSKTGIWTAGTIPPGSYEIMDIETEVIQSGTLINTSCVRTVNEFDVNLANHSYSATCMVKNQPVQNLKTCAANRKVLLQWTPPPGAISYNIYRKTDRDDSYTLIKEGYRTRYGNYGDFGLINRTDYCYLVTWLDTSGQESLASNESCATPRLLPWVRWPGKSGENDRPARIYQDRGSRDQFRGGLFPLEW